MSNDISDIEKLEFIKAKMADMPAESANEIALLLMFAEYAGLSHPSLKTWDVEKERAKQIESRMTDVINDLTAKERERLSPIIRCIQMIKLMSEKQ